MDPTRRASADQLFWSCFSHSDVLLCVVIGFVEKTALEHVARVTDIFCRVAVFAKALSLCVEKRYCAAQRRCCSCESVLRGDKIIFVYAALRSLLFPCCLVA